MLHERFPLRVLSYNWHSLVQWVTSLFCPLWSIRTTRRPWERRRLVLACSSLLLCTQFGCRLRSARRSGGGRWRGWCLWRRASIVFYSWRRPAPFLRRLFAGFPWVSRQTYQIYINITCDISCTNIFELFEKFSHIYKMVHIVIFFIKIIKLVEIHTIDMLELFEQILSTHPSFQLHYLFSY